MKRRELEQLKVKPDAELQKDLEAQRDQLWALKKDLAAGKVKNVKEITRVRGIIARILTILSWRKKQGV